MTRPCQDSIFFYVKHVVAVKIPDKGLFVVLGKLNRKRAR